MTTETSSVASLETDYMPPPPYYEEKMNCHNDNDNNCARGYMIVDHTHDFTRIVPWGPELEEEIHRQQNAPPLLSPTKTAVESMMMPTLLDDDYPRVISPTAMDDGAPSCLKDFAKLMIRQQQDDSTNDNNDYDDSTTKKSNEEEGGTFEPSQEEIHTRFADIIGHGAAKLRIDEILLPFALPTVVTKAVLKGVRSQPASILLYGPPGCGKTQLAKAIAGESSSSFISIGPSDVLSKFFGESEALVRNIFRNAREAARNAESGCCILFFDEIDALGISRGSASAEGAQDSGGCSRRILAELLIQMSNEGQTSGGESTKEMDNHDGDGDVFDSETNTRGTKNGGGRVLIVAATNRPEDCDPALLRRFAIRVHVGLPSSRDRKRMLSKFLRDFDHSLSKEELNQLVKTTHGWSGSDLESVTREAAMTPIRECLRVAAIAKKRARRKGNSTKAEDLARNHLLKSFQSLRPVTLGDFESAMSFWLGNQGKLEKDVDDDTHYDSCSDDESDQED